MKKLIIVASFFIAASVFMVIAGSCVAAADSASSYSPVSVAEVWQAIAGELRSRGLADEQLPPPADVELPAAVPARAGRSLSVSSVCWDGEAHSVRFRLVCREAGACLPFLVYLRQNLSETFYRSSHAEAPACRAQSSRRTSSSSAPSREMSVRAGERATVVLSASGLRMTASVTCLERGSRGEIIRVRGVEGRIFRARVAGQALVEALPE
ncbi:MAG: flagella basal body P-ring formation protein FlgA [Terriglobales bacterium]